MKSPIFIFSLPRSGSTLLQRILAQHEQIATVSEPWFLLHLMYAMRSEGTLSEYSHRNSQLAIRDLINQLPQKEEDYYASVRLMANSIYSKLCHNDEMYYLDKTPRYYKIANELFKLYPNAKFVFLFRNPMDIYASTMKTWGNNTFKKLYTAHDDLEFGWQKMAEAYLNFKGAKIITNYENLVSNSAHETLKLYHFLNLEKPITTSSKLTKLEGKLGDQTGIKKYDRVERKSIDNWQEVFNTKFRKNYLKKYVSRLREKDLSIAGYEKESLLNKIEEHKVPFFSIGIKDRYHLFFYKTAMVLNAHLLFTSVFSWAKRKYLS